MQKKIIEEPIYQTVQTGVSQKEIWVTSDGTEHENEKYAEHFEFYKCKIKQRGFDIPDRVAVMDLYCLEDLERYEKDYTYNIDTFHYDKTKLTFPNTYVLYETLDEVEDDHDYGLHCVTLDEYKKYVNEKLNEIKAL